MTYDVNLYSFGKDIERARLKRESSSKLNTEQRIHMFKNGSPYKQYSMEEKYIYYKLSFLSPFDNELYFVLETLLKHSWTPLDGQVSLEENMINDIYSERMKFFGDECEIVTTAGDILLYFAEKIAFNTETSVATSCELLLKNIGIILPARSEQEVLEAWSRVEYSDILPEQYTLFDQEYYDWNSSYYCDGQYCVPSWWEQYQYYLSVLIPES